MSNTGGFLNGLHKGMAVGTAILCSVLANSKLLKMMLEFDENFHKECSSDDEYQSDIKKHIVGI